MQNCAIWPMATGSTREAFYCYYVFPDCSPPFSVGIFTNAVADAQSGGTDVSNRGKTVKKYLA